MKLNNRIENLESLLGLQNECNNAFLLCVETQRAMINQLIEQVFKLEKEICEMKEIAGISTTTTISSPSIKIDDSWTKVLDNLFNFKSKKPQKRSKKNND